MYHITPRICARLWPLDVKNCPLGPDGRLFWGRICGSTAGGYFSRFAHLYSGANSREDAWLSVTESRWNI